MTLCVERATRDPPLMRWKHICTIMTRSHSTRMRHASMRETTMKGIKHTRIFTPRSRVVVVVVVAVAGTRVASRATHQQQYPPGNYDDDAARENTTLVTLVGGVARGTHAAHVCAVVCGWLITVMHVYECVSEFLCAARNFCNEAKESKTRTRPSQCVLCIGCKYML